MKLYTYKPFSYGFVILCHDHGVKLVKNTAASIQRNYPKAPILCVADSSANADDLKELKKICPTVKGKDTFSSGINAGMKKAPADWNFIVIAGTWVRPQLDIRFSYFMESEKDILFPIADGQYNFVDGTLNGLLIHKKTFKEIGDMASDNPLEICKLMWALDAIALGCVFKAVIGTKIC